MFSSDTGQVFYFDKDSKVAYLVNFQEKVYIRINRGSIYYKLVIHLYCRDWNCRPDEVNSFKQVFNTWEIDGSEKE